MEQQGNQLFAAKGSTKAGAAIAACHGQRQLSAHTGQLIQPVTSVPLCLPACLPARPCVCRFVELENTGVMREHLQSTMYISGTSDKGYTDRRGYRRSR